MTIISASSVARAFSDQMESSPPRKRGSRANKKHWIPASAGMTARIQRIGKCCGRLGRASAWGLLLGLVLAVGALAPFSASAVEVERVLSPRGVEAWLVQDHANPIISLSLAFRGGASLDPAAREGLARMTAALIDEGAGDLDSQAFQRRLEDMAITLHFDAGRDTFRGTLKTLTRNRDAAFELLGLALGAPRFDAEPIARIRSQLLVGLRQDAEDPHTVAADRLFKSLFPSHPYGRPVRGTEQSVAAITVGDLREFAATRLARDTLAIGVVGDITPGRLAALLDSTFAGLPEKSAPNGVPDILPAAGGGTSVVEMAVPQSAIIFAQPGLKRDHPDFYTAFVLNYVLGGGGFTSRLYREIREKRGLAYSVYTSLYPFDHTALILGGAGTANARVAETLDVVRAEWRRLAEGGLTADELADAKTFLTGSFALRFTSSGRIASMLVGMQLDDLGIDYFDRRNDYIEAVTLAGVNRVAGRMLKVGNLRAVVVGQPDGL